MGRQRRKMNRRKQPYAKQFDDNKISRSSLIVASNQLSYCEFQHSKNVTFIWLFIGDQGLLRERNSIRRRLLKYTPKEKTFDNLQKCISYIKHKRISQLRLQLYKNSIAEIKTTREMIQDACKNNQLTYFEIFNVTRIRFGSDGFFVHGGAKDDNDQRQNVNNELPIPMAIYSLVHSEQKSLRDLTADEIRFMWYQLLINVLLQIPRNTANINDMLDVARTYYSTDSIELNKIDKFERTYKASNAIRWYTQDTFLYRLLNMAFRTQDIRVIFVFRFFILDLHTQLANVATNEIDIPSSTLFRGQLLSIEELNTIKKNIGGFISMNTFLSTTTDCQVACDYAGVGSAPAGYTSVLFEINLNNTKNVTYMRPFASITEYSKKKDEGEILFSMGSVFRIISVEEYDSMYSVDLEIDNQSNENLLKLSTHLLSRKSGYTVDEVTFGDFLLDMGELKQAEQFYKLMVEQLSPDFFNLELARLQNSVGVWNTINGDFRLAKRMLEEALAMAQGHKTLTSTILNNLGLAHLNLGYYSRALKCFKRSKKLNDRKGGDAVICANISSIYIMKGLYQKAKYFAQKALSIDKKYLPDIHPNLASNYSLLASIEQNIGSLGDALDLYEKALAIYRESLPPNHHLLAHALNNIGVVYSCMDQYHRALEYHEEALKILLVSFENNKDKHLLVVQSLNNIAACHCGNNDFQAAEVAFRRALGTKLEILGEESKLHPSVAVAYHNLGVVQMKQARFDEAFLNLERAVEIEESIGNKAAISDTYDSMGNLFMKKHAYVDAERWYSKAYNSALVSLPNHPNIRSYERGIEHARMMIAKSKEKVNVPES